MTPPRFDAIIIGAGFGGIGAAITLRQLGFDSLLIVEREDDLGGTWHINRYPGLACDIPSPTYAYWFEPNPYWSRMFAPGTEIRRYAAHVAHKYDVRRHMRFRTAAERADWDAHDRHWVVTLAGGETVSARYLVTATGFLSQPRIPDLPGLDDFAGRVMHSAAWDDRVDLTGHRIGVIGTGATAVQLIPELADRAAELTVFQRTPIHVVPKNDVALPGGVQRLLARFPAAQRALRRATDANTEMMFVLGVLRYRHFAWLPAIAARLSAGLRLLSVRDAELRRQLTPRYDFGCKRPTYSNTYYRTFAREHVRLQTSAITRVEPGGVVTADGVTTPLDTLVLATGFDLWDANLPALPIRGRDGVELGRWWRQHGFQAYQGLTVPGFPNLLSLASPYAFSLNFFNTMEYQMRHMDRLFGELRRRDADTFEVTPEANARFRDRMRTLQHDTLLYLGDCTSSRSYYFGPGGETFLRATSTRTTVSEQDRFPLDDYAIA